MYLFNQPIESFSQWRVFLHKVKMFIMWKKLSDSSWFTYDTFTSHRKKMVNRGTIFLSNCFNVYKHIHICSIHKLFYVLTYFIKHIAEILLLLAFATNIYKSFILILFDLIAFFVWCQNLTLCVLFCDHFKPSYDSYFHMISAFSFPC